MRPRLPALLLAIAGLLAACDSSDPVRPGNPAHFIGATVAANPNNVISAVVTVTATGYDSAWVRFWHDSSAVQRTPAYPFGTDSVLTIPVLGMDTTVTHQLEVVLQRGAHSPVAGDTLGFTTGALPAWVPHPGTLGTDTVPGYLLLSLPDGPIIIDNQAKVLWYRTRPGGVLGSWTTQLNGTYTWLSAADSSGYYVHNVLGEETGRLACVGFKTRFHDVLVLADGSAWIMCDQESYQDLTGYGGQDSAFVTSTVVQHLSPTGQLLFEWRTLDHFSFDDIDPAQLTGASINFTHGNAIDLDTDGKVLLSSRSLSEITKIDPATGSIVWRFGGLANQFTILGDPKGAFQRQHGLRVVGPNHLQFLDNSSSIPSRMVRYTLDTVAMTATLDWQFIDSPTTFAGVGGATQVYPNGGGMVTFGPAGRLIEVDSLGQRSWELTGVDGLYIFRAQRLHSLYFPAQGLDHR